MLSRKYQVIKYRGTSSLSVRTVKQLTRRKPLLASGSHSRARAGTFP